MRTFVDTNVFVYALDGREPAKERRAREVISAAPENLVVSTQVLGELYVTLTRKFARAYTAPAARAAVTRVARVHVVSIDASLVESALAIAEAGPISYWDALIVAAAAAAGCERILTEDLAAGSVINGVRVENPFAPRHRLAESTAPYGSIDGPWTDATLRDALDAYRDACGAAGMRPNAVHSYWDYARRFLDWRVGGYHPRGTEPSGRPVPDEPASLADLRTQVAAYARAIRTAGREEVTVATYGRHAMFFVRWLAGEFAPGDRLRVGRVTGRHRMFVARS